MQYSMADEYNLQYNAARAAAKSFIVYLYCLHAVDEMRIFNLF